MKKLIIALMLLSPSAYAATKAKSGSCEAAFSIEYAKYNALYGPERLQVVPSEIGIIMIATEGNKLLSQFAIIHHTIPATAKNGYSLEQVGTCREGGELYNMYLVLPSVTPQKGI